MNTETNQHLLNNDQTSQNNATSQPSTINRLNRSVRRSFRRARDRVFSNERNTPTRTNSSVNARVSRESAHRHSSPLPNSHSSSLSSETFRNTLTATSNNHVNSLNHVNSPDNLVNSSNINTQINPIRPSGIDLTHSSTNPTTTHSLSTPTQHETNWNSQANLEHLMEMHNNNIFEENGAENSELDMTRNYFDENFEHFFDGTKFLNPCDRIQSILELREKVKGTFLVRKKYDSPRKPYVISVKIDNQFINHLWIRVSRKTPTITAEKVNNVGDSDKIDNIDGNSHNMNTSQPELSLHGSKISDLDTSPASQLNSIKSKSTISISSPKKSFPTKSSSNSSQFTFLTNKNPLPPDYSFHIDFGEQTFSNITTLLQYYTKHNLGELFANCDTTLQQFLSAENLKMKPNLNDSSNSTDDDLVSGDSGLNSSDEPLRRPLPSSLKDNNCSGIVDVEAKVIIFSKSSENEDSEKSEYSNVVTLKYAYKTTVKYEFNRNSFKEFRENTSVVENMIVHQEVYVLEDSVQCAIEHNWVKAVIDLKSVQYVPKNYLVSESDVQIN